MQLRKSITRPSRLEDEEPITPQNRKGTRPAFPDLMQRGVIAFNPHHPPAAFPSLPLTSQPLCAQNTITSVDRTDSDYETSQQDSSRPLSTSIPDSSSAGIGRQLASQTAASNAEPRGFPSHNEAARKGPKVGIMMLRAQSKVVTGSGGTFSTTNNKNSKANKWSSLRLAVQYHIFEALKTKYQLDVDTVIKKLGLTQTEAVEIQRAAAERLARPTSFDRIWELCLRASSPIPGLTGQSHIEPELFIKNLDHLSFACRYDTSDSVNVQLGRDYLSDRGLHPDLVGEWFQHSPSDPRYPGMTFSQPLQEFTISLFLDSIPAFASSFAHAQLPYYENDQPSSGLPASIQHAVLTLHDPAETEKEGQAILAWNGQSKAVRSTGVGGRRNSHNHEQRILPVAPMRLTEAVRIHSAQHGIDMTRHHVGPTSSGQRLVLKVQDDGVARVFKKTPPSTVTPTQLSDPFTPTETADTQSGDKPTSDNQFAPQILPFNTTTSGFTRKLLLGTAQSENTDSETDAVFATPVPSRYIGSDVSKVKTATTTVGHPKRKPSDFDIRPEANKLPRLQTNIDSTCASQHSAPESRLNHAHPCDQAKETLDTQRPRSQITSGTSTPWKSSSASSSANASATKPATPSAESASSPVTVMRSPPPPLFSPISDDESLLETHALLNPVDNRLVVTDTKPKEKALTKIRLLIKPRNAVTGAK